MRTGFSQNFTKHLGGYLGRDGGIAYTIRRSQRARNLRISVYPDGRVVLTRPWFVPGFVAELFLRKKMDWIVTRLRQIKGRELGRRAHGRELDPLLNPMSGQVSNQVIDYVPSHANARRRHYAFHKEKARALITARVEYFAQQHEFIYQRLSIKNLRSRWGSCSQKGNLNFHYRLAALPPEILDYVVVHELCHLRNLNHSQKFWAEVAKIVPDYKILRKQLKDFSL